MLHCTLFSLMRLVKEVSSIIESVGEPPSVLTWSKLNDDRRFPNGSTLQLAMVDLSHIGNYSCMPVNQAGSGQSASVSLNVIGELLKCFCFLYKHALMHMHRYTYTHAPHSTAHFGLCFMAYLSRVTWRYETPKGRRWEAGGVAAADCVEAGCCDVSLWLSLNDSI